MLLYTCNLNILRFIFGALMQLIYITKDHSFTLIFFLTMLGQDFAEKHELKLRSARYASCTEYLQYYRAGLSNLHGPTREMFYFTPLRSKQSETGLPRRLEPPRLDNSSR